MITNSCEYDRNGMYKHVRAMFIFDRRIDKLEDLFLSGGLIRSNIMTSSTLNLIKVARNPIDSYD
jgi:hypothetical protein